MDCQAARLLLWFQRPQAKELTADDEAALARHCLDCPSCARFARLFGQEDRLLGRALRDVPVPPTLKASVLTRLEAAAPRRADGRGWNRTLASLSVMSAALAGAIAFGLWWFWPLPTISLAELQGWGKARFSLPVNYPADDKINWLEQHFYSHGAGVRVPAALRSQWDFSHLSAAYVAELSHGPIAVAEFKKPGGHAILFLLPADRLRPEEVAGLDRLDSDTCLLRPIPDEGFMAFVVMKEGAVDQFLLKR